jgi:hypothetical protein
LPTQIIEGAELPGLSGRDINNSVYVSRQQARGDPRQIDQRDSTGCWVWTVAYRQSYQLDTDNGTAPVIRKPETAGAGTVDDQDPKGKALLDGNDVLVFMADDLGDRGTKAQRALHAALVQEIEVVDTGDGTRGWAYVAYYPDAPAPLRDTLLRTAPGKNGAFPHVRFRFGRAHGGHS